MEGRKNNFYYPAILLNTRDQPKKMVIDNEFPANHEAT